MLAILEAFRIYSCSFQDMLIVESDLSNAVQWVSHRIQALEVWLYFKEIKELSSCLHVFFLCGNYSFILMRSRNCPFTRGFSA